MTRLEFFERGFGFDALKLGVMPVGFLVKYDIYKTYVALRDNATGRYEKKETEARRLTVEKTRSSYSYVCRAIIWFEEDFAKTRKSNCLETSTFNRSKDKNHALPIS